MTRARFKLIIVNVTPATQVMAFTVSIGSRPWKFFKIRVFKTRGNFTKLKKNTVGTLCFDVDECEEVDACGKHMDCVDTEGNYTCSCSHGYENRNGECIDIDECLRV